MKQVIRYQCEFCKKEFRTPDRHKCKFDPKLKNCFTCKNFKGWNEGEMLDDGIWAPNYPDCATDIDGWDIESMKDESYNMQCESWVEGEFDWTNYWANQPPNVWDLLLEG